MKTLIYFSVFLILMVSVCQCEELSKNETTTTPKPTTTTKKPTTTTPKPTTTTEAPKTTTEPPHPHPQPEFPIVAGNITNGTKDSYPCLRYHFTVIMKLAQMGKDNKTNFEYVTIPHDAKVDSNKCQNDKMEEFWFKFGKNDSSMLKLTFEKNEASVYLSSIMGNVSLENNHYYAINVTAPNPNFNVDKSHSYYCANNVTITLDDKESLILFSNVTLQAFMEPSQKGAFSQEHNCQNEINDVVPIAVGVALTSLVIIVMIAYFIGRRRSRRLAYQSV